mgnify:FL=1
MSYHIDLAKAISKIAHRGQKYGDHDYFSGHIEVVVENLERDAGKTTYKDVAVAYLHDVLEDTTFTAQDLLDLGVGSHIVETVSFLTRRDEIYTDYINRLSTDRSAALVKRADLRANLEAPGSESLKSRYIKALAVLEKA